MPEQLLEGVTVELGSEPESLRFAIKCERELPLTYAFMDAIRRLPLVEAVTSPILLGGEFIFIVTVVPTHRRHAVGYVERERVITEVTGMIKENLHLFHFKHA